MTTETPVGPTTEPPRRRTDEILAMLAERVGGRFTASTVFGSPVEREGVTVIPVSTIRFGFGGGGGTDPNSEQSGEAAADQLRDRGRPGHAGLPGRARRMSGKRHSRTYRRAGRFVQIRSGSRSDYTARSSE